MVKLQSALVKETAVLLQGTASLHFSVHIGALDHSQGESAELRPALHVKATGFS